MGVCMETLDADKHALAAETKDMGNYAICHWFYFLGRSSFANATITNGEYFETRFYNEKEWGKYGSGINAANMQQSGT